MKIIKNIIVAFSLYSQIPMPRFEWKEEDMKHNIIFLPWIGAVIGILSWGLCYLLDLVRIPIISIIALYSLIPLLITGGFHVDGYMDVQDALKSYKPAEEKLEILKDPHIGAFAIIRLLIFSLVWGAAFGIIVDSRNDKCLMSYMTVFFVARAISTLSSIKLKHARKNGMLNMETSKSSKTDLYICLAQALAGIVFVAVISPVISACMAIVAVIHFIYYRKLCYSQFGGITGDTAGFYITTLEEWLVVAIAVLSFFI